VSGPPGVPADAGEFAASLEQIRRRIRPGSEPRIGVGAGWVPIIASLNEKLTAIDPEHSILGVEERYGLLVWDFVSPGGHDQAMQSAIDAAAEEAASCCEICGAPGRLMSRGESGHKWLKTVCPACAQDRGYRPEAVR
jgi:hypothetical protein